jgi:hypothetical protein
MISSAYAVGAALTATAVAAAEKAQQLATETPPTTETEQGLSPSQYLGLAVTGALTGVLIANKLSQRWCRQSLFQAATAPSNTNPRLRGSFLGGCDLALIKIKAHNPRLSHNVQFQKKIDALYKELVACCKELPHKTTSSRINERLNTLRTELGKLRDLDIGPGLLERESAQKLLKTLKQLAKDILASWVRHVSWEHAKANCKYDVEGELVSVSSQLQQLQMNEVDTLASEETQANSNEADRGVKRRYLPSAETTPEAAPTQTAAGRSRSKEVVLPSHTLDQLSEALVAAMKAQNTGNGRLPHDDALKLRRALAEACGGKDKVHPMHGRDKTNSPKSLANVIRDTLKEIKAPGYADAIEDFLRLEHGIKL